ncbi:MAG: hypothetical protein ACRC7N_02180 [Clostridium sp.]
MKVNLNDVIECIEHEGEYLTHFYNKKTGVIIYIEDESTSSYKAEDINELERFEDWERELINILNDFKKNPNDYIKLPSIEEMDHYNMMMEFCMVSLDEEARELMLAKVNGNNDLRKLREVLEDNGILNSWYDYRETVEKDIAIKWCENNNIKYM